MAPAVERREHVGRRLSDRSISPAKARHSPRGRSPPRNDRSPIRRRSPDRMRSPKRSNSSHKKSPAKEKVPDRSRLVRGRSPPRTSSSRSPSPRTKRLRRAQAEQESEKGKGGEHVRSPKRSNSSHKKSPTKEKVPDKGRLIRGRSPPRTSSSRSPSPRTKRLRRAQAEQESEKRKSVEHVKRSREERTKAGEGELREKRRSSPPRSPSPHSKRLLRAQAEREAEKSKGQEHGRSMSREERDRERHGERGEARDTVKEKRPRKDKSDGGSSRPSRRDLSVSPARRDQSVSPERNRRNKHSPRSPSRVSKDGTHEESSRSRATERSRDDDADSIARMKAAEESLEAKEKDKQKPSFELSGKLAEETNRVRGVTLLFNEPADARKPDVRWRLYVFKAGDVLNEPLYVHRQSCYLFGRERRVADIPTDHPSCSKQHAVIQYRLVEKEQSDGLLSKQVRPYLMDLGSTNGTFINDNRIEPQRYYELVEKDTIRFGNSSREYVILHENSAT